MNKKGYLLFLSSLILFSWPHEKRLQRLLHKLWPDRQIQWIQISHQAFRDKSGKKANAPSDLNGTPDRLYRLTEADSLLGWLLIRQTAACHLGSCFEGKQRKNKNY